MSSRKNRKEWAIETCEAIEEHLLRLGVSDATELTVDHAQSCCVSSKRRFDRSSVKYFVTCTDPLSSDQDS